VHRSRFLIPAGFFLALAGGGLAVSASTLGRRADLAALCLETHSAPDRRPGDPAARVDRDAEDSFAQADPIPTLRSLRFAILRSQSPPFGN